MKVVYKGKLQEAEITPHYDDHPLRPKWTQLTMVSVPLLIIGTTKEDSFISVTHGEFIEPFGIEYLRNVYIISTNKHERIRLKEGYYL